jgi:hypothetical protein
MGISMHFQVNLQRTFSFVAWSTKETLHGAWLDECRRERHHDLFLALNANSWRHMVKTQFTDRCGGITRVCCFADRLVPTAGPGLQAAEWLLGPQASLCMQRTCLVLSGNADQLTTSSVATRGSTDIPTHQSPAPKASHSMQVAR